MTTQVSFHEGEMRDTGDDVDVYVYTSDIDGVTVIEIETHGLSDTPEVRVVLNDGIIWDGYDGPLPLKQL